MVSLLHGCKMVGQLRLLREPRSGPLRRHPAGPLGPRGRGRCALSSWCENRPDDTDRGLRDPDVLVGASVVVVGTVPEPLERGRRRRSGAPQTKSVPGAHPRHPCSVTDVDVGLGVGARSARTE